MPRISWLLVFTCYDLVRGRGFRDSKQDVSVLNKMCYLTEVVDVYAVIQEGGETGIWVECGP